MVYNLHRSIMKVLYCAIGFCKETNEQRMKTFLSEQHATNRNKDSNDEMVNEFKLTVALTHEDLCTRVDLPLYKKTVENQDWATGPSGLRAAGPSRAVG